MDVDPTFFERYGRQMDVKTTLCAYWYWKAFVNFNVLKKRVLAKINQLGQA